MIVLEADLTWSGASFEPGQRVAVGDDGRITAVGADLGSATPVQRLAGRALLPGFVNAHSHAFQRGLRGRGERFPAGAGSFWTWREAMYALVDSLDAAGLRALAGQAFREMLAAGITSVGEFHYLHHGRTEREAWTMDEALLAAARDAGIRVVLLQVFYRHGGIGKPLAGAQLRFDARSVDEYWRHLDALRPAIDPARASLGVAPHSIRAVGLDDLARLHVEARSRGLVVHMHLDETRQEEADCRAAHGLAPLELVLERLEPDGSFTAVHGTHAEPRTLDAFLERGANLCLCPLTEANLGDGLPRLSNGRGSLALGTDSNARISMLEELRWCEYGQRLRREERGALADDSGAVARRLLQAATTGGARSLGLPCGAIEPGRWADFVEVDLGSPELAGWTSETLPESLVFGAGERALAGTWVGGRRVPG